MTEERGCQASDLKLCPFCAYFFVTPEPIGTDFYGGAAKVGEVPSCESYAVVQENANA